MDHKIKIALLQLDGANNKERLFSKAEKALVIAKKKGVDIALFPEMWTIGYEEYPTDKEKRHVWKEKSIWVGHKEYERYSKLAKEIGIAIVFTFLESNQGKTEFYNTATLIDANGKTVLHYRKTHLVDKGWESMFVAGEKFPVAELKTSEGIVKIGVMICYDREFPEVARILMLHGAELILVPNACILENNRIAQFQSRGFENMVGVAMANYPRFNGKSVAFDGMRKKGEEYSPLIVMGDSSENIFIAEFNLSELREYRKKEIWGDAYRRPHLYEILSDNNSKPPFKRKDARR
ncbi:carbon-nitrogen hydrolase family protein [Candidatus Pacearchaeota archaeon]|nr:carbon-nitrogen hydrolase family protein [Candidatus Pacearchaeota archaeon]